MIVKDSIGKLAIFASDDAVQMVGLDHPSMHSQCLIADAKVERIDHDVPINFAAEYIDPGNDLKCHEKRSVLVSAREKTGHYGILRCNLISLPL